MATSREDIAREVQDHIANLRKAFAGLVSSFPIGSVERKLTVEEGEDEETAEEQNEGLVQAVKIQDETFSDVHVGLQTQGYRSAVAAQRITHSTAQLLDIVYQLKLARILFDRESAVAKADAMDARCDAEIAALTALTLKQKPPPPPQQ
jgi:hypothetical protein